MSDKPSFFRRALPLAIALAAGAGIALAITYSMQGRDVPADRSHDVAEAAADPQRAATQASGPRRIVTSPEALDAMRTERIAEADRFQQAEHSASARAYAAQRVDAAWASNKETELLEANVAELMQGAGAVPQDIDIDCRSTICRIQADFQTRGQGEDWIGLYPLAVGGAMPSLTYEWSRTPDGKPRVVVYGVARQ